MVKNKKQGFTLIELLVVIAIIGILAAIVLVSLSGARAKARDAVRQSDIRQIALAMEMYYDENGAYLTSSSMPTKIDPTDGKYLNPVPTDPSTKTSYNWIDNSGDGTRYCTYAQLENGKFFAASHKGTKLLDTAPTGLDCW